MFSIRKMYTPLTFAHVYFLRIKFEKNSASDFHQSHTDHRFIILIPCPIKRNPRTLRVTSNLRFTFSPTLPKLLLAPNTDQQNKHNPCCHKFLITSERSKRSSY